MGVATAVAVGGLALSASQAIKEAKEKKRIDRELNSLQQPELSNAFSDDTVSTLGADLRREENAVNSATAVDALQQAGGREIIGGVGRIQAETNRNNAEIAANLDEQQKAIDNQESLDDIRLRNLREQRHNADLAALSSQYNTANMAQQQAIGNIFQSAGGLQGIDYAGNTPQVGMSGAQNIAVQSNAPSSYGTNPPPIQVPKYFP